jgi:hypothetical protein
MRITKEQLKNYGLFDKLPEPLRTMESGSKFVFYYDVDEESVKLKMYEYGVFKDVNVSLYRGIESMVAKYNTVTLNLGFFSDTFETRDGLFYQFLRTYNDAEDVANLYDYAIEEDRSVDVSVSINAITNIYNSDDFRRSISFFCSSKLQSIMFVYDMVNDVFKNRLSKSLYGESIKKVVNLIKFDGGVLPEINGELRFMVIGENAKLTEDQIQKLDEAKVLLRSLQSIDNIYQYTGWSFSQYDGKWRTNIADNEAKIDKTLLYEVDGRMLYKPANISNEDLMILLQNPTKLYGYNYQGRLIDVLKHPTLYKYYPKLALVPLLYYYGNKAGGNDFYFSPNERGGLILINGDKKSGDSLSILLHEIQHYIQNQEGFATGGNMFLAQFVASLGGAKVRQIFSTINRMERYFRDHLIDDNERLELVQAVKSQLAFTSQSREIKNTLLGFLNNRDEYKDNYKTINFYLIVFIAENGDFSTNNVTLLLQEKFGDIIFELLENITEAYKSAKYYKEKLSSEGYRQDDIDRILFSSYQNLYGELESRSTQSSRFVESEYKNYFYLTKWENSPLQNIVIIDGIEKIIESDKVKAVVLEKDHGIAVLP